MDIENTTGNAINRRKFIEKSAVLSAFMIVPRFVLGGKGYTAPSDMITLGHIGAGKQAFGLKRLSWIRARLKLWQPPMFTALK